MFEVRCAMCEHSPDGGIEAILGTPKTLGTFDDEGDAMDWIDSQDFVVVERGVEVWKNVVGQSVWIEEIE